MPRLRQYSKVELRLRPGHWAMLLGTLLVEVAAISLSWGREPAWDTLVYAVYALANVVAGVLILARHPGHVIGWLLIATGLLVQAIVSDLGQGWALSGTSRGWPGAADADLAANSVWAVGGAIMAATFVLFPDGSAPQQGRVWPWVLPLGCLGSVVLMAGWATGDDVSSLLVGGRNPLLAESVPSGLLFMGGLTAVGASMLLGALAMVLRMRQAHGVERQQLKWMVFAVGLSVIVLPVGAPFYTNHVWVRILMAGVLTAIPLAALAAIWALSALRHRADHQPHCSLRLRHRRAGWILRGTCRRSGGSLLTRLDPRVGTRQPSRRACIPAAAEVAPGLCRPLVRPRALRRPERHLPLHGRSARGQTRARGGVGGDRERLGSHAQRRSASRARAHP